MPEGNKKEEESEVGMPNFVKKPDKKGIHELDEFFQWLNTSKESLEVEVRTPLKLKSGLGPGPNNDDFTESAKFSSKSTQTVQFLKQTNKNIELLPKTQF